jgi:hypothetical protein
MEDEIREDFLQSLRYPHQLTVDHRYTMRRNLAVAFAGIQEPVESKFAGRAPLRSAGRGIPIKLWRSLVSL